MDEEIALNYETFKSQNAHLHSTNRKLLKLILRESSREVVIDVLKELKIIHNGYNPKTDKLELMEVKQ